MWAQHIYGSFYDSLEVNFKVHFPGFAKNRTVLMAVRRVLWLRESYCRCPLSCCLTTLTAITCANSAYTHFGNAFSNTNIGELRSCSFRVKDETARSSFLGRKTRAIKCQFKTITEHKSPVCQCCDTLDV
ncbi:hypothetical protein J6590_063206 [Homalodisca vitripennis]|nr:hypothetical protein J6590_063206 [Homalodisca vitripennis]